MTQSWVKPHTTPNERNSLFIPFNSMFKQHLAANKNKTNDPPHENSVIIREVSLERSLLEHIKEGLDRATIQYNTKFIYIVGDTNSITLAMNSYLPTYKLRQVYIHTSTTHT